MNIILHLGLPKTATTFLQQDVFLNLKDVNVLFKFKNVQEYKNDWLYNLILNIDKPIDLQELKKRRAEYLLENIPNLVTEETFYCGGFGGMFNKEDNRFIMLDRIYKIFPEARVILTIRDKKNLLVSWYKQYIANGGVLVFDDFIRNRMNLEKINYEKYIKKLKDFYSKDNVYIIKYEKFITKPKQTIEEICDFIGCKVPDYKIRKRNVGYGKTEIKTSLILNRFFKTRVHNHGIHWPEKYFHLPHRLIFQSKLLERIPRKKIELRDLIQSEEIKKRIDIFLQN